MSTSRRKSSMRKWRKSTFMHSVRGTALTQEQAVSGGALPLLSGKVQSRGLSLAACVAVDGGPPKMTSGCCQHTVSEETTTGVFKLKIGAKDELFFLPRQRERLRDGVYRCSHPLNDGIKRSTRRCLHTSMWPRVAPSLSVALALTSSRARRGVKLAFHCRRAGSTAETTPPCPLCESGGDAKTPGLPQKSREKRHVTIRH